MNIQLIDKQPFIFRVNAEIYLFAKPNFLYKNCNELIKAVSKGSVIGWNIQGGFISFNQIKNIYKIKNYDTQKNRKFNPLH